jgi:signal transduction histidine kinase
LGVAHVSRITRRAQQSFRPDWGRNRREGGARRLAAFAFGSEVDGSRGSLTGLKSRRNPDERCPPADHRDRPAHNRGVDSVTVSTLPIVATSSTNAIKTKAQDAEGTAATDTYSTRSRQLLGVVVIAAVMLLQAVSQFLSGHERSRVIAHLAFLATEMPVIALALSTTYRGAIRRSLRPFRALMACVLVAGALGLVFGAALFVVGQYYPNVRLHAGPAPTLPRTLLFGFTQGQLQAGLWTLAFVLPFAIDDARMRGLEAEQLRSAAELARLRANLEPHFLLNTLNAIAGLVTEDPREARKLIACLGDLLRDALRDDDEMQTLEEQIAWLRRYASILQARHGDALRFEWRIADEARGVLLPRLLLQPLVENAVKHGALCRKGGGVVIISAEIASKPSAVICTVEDNGPGASEVHVRSGAFGLNAVRKRLELRYSGATLKLESSTEGTRSIVRFPRQALVETARRGAEPTP